VRRPLPPSLYAETARPAPPTPPLQGDRRVAVAIVGGGFTGLSAALHLAERGVEVAVLEAHEPGWGGSGRNGGQVNPGLKHDPDVVERDFGPELGGRMVALSGGAPNVVFDLVQRHQIKCEAHQSGTLRAAIAAPDVAGVQASAAQWQRRDAPVALLQREALRTATGTPRYAAALLDRRGGQVNPLGYARGLAQAAMQAGAMIFGGSPAQRAARRGPLWHVSTPDGTLRADKLVLATNGYSDGLWTGLRRSIVPVYSAIVASAPLPDALAAQIMPTRAVLYELGHVTVYYRLDAGNRLLMGGRSVQRDIGRPSELRYLSAYAQRLWPALRGVGWTHAWSGQLAITRDHYPHIHEPQDDVLVCLGYNGRGVAMSTAMGPQIARRLMAGRAADIDMPITTMHEIPFHGLWRSAVTARMIHGRIRDWLGL
jgi:glycine/D-amino acid oxidase-like deaminating enzyme